jgi:hypothetical protein
MLPIFLLLLLLLLLLLKVVMICRSWWFNTLALFLWEVSESLSTRPRSRLVLEPWSMSLACRKCHTWTIEWPILQFSRPPTCCSLSHTELMKCEPQSGVPENNGKACEMWLVVHKRASWYKNTESWNHSTLHWWNRPGIGYCDWCPTPLVRWWLLY